MGRGALARARASAIWLQIPWRAPHKIPCVPVSHENARAPKPWCRRQLVCVDFTATWCGPCKTIAPKVAEMAGMYECQFLKVDVDENEETTTACNITNMPTFQFYKVSPSLPPSLARSPSLARALSLALSRALSCSRACARSPHPSLSPYLSPSLSISLLLPQPRYLPNP
jgi:hypothetical protein